MVRLTHGAGRKIYNAADRGLSEQMIDLVHTCLSACSMLQLLSEEFDLQSCIVQFCPARRPTDVAMLTHVKLRILSANHKFLNSELII